MPRKSPRIPGYRLHKSTGKAIVTLGGRDIYLGVHGSPESESAYQRVVAEWLASGCINAPLQSSRTTSTNRSSDGPTVGELVLDYLAFAKDYYVKDGRLTGEYANVKDAARPWVMLYGDTLLTDFGPLALKTVRQGMIESDLSRKVINSRVNRIRRMIKWAVENERVAPQVLHAVQAIAPLKAGRCGVREAPGVRPVADDLIDPVLAVVSPPIAAMIQAQRYTGMRPCEVTIMRGCDIDTSGPVWVYRPTSHKTEHHGKQRVVYLGPKAQEVIRPMLKTDLAAYLFSPCDSMRHHWQTRREGRQTRVQPSQTNRQSRRPRKKPGDCYTTTTYARAIQYGCDKAFPPPPSLQQTELTESETVKLKAWRKAHRWTPNQLRHNAATYLRKQFGIEAARVVLGHSSASVTEIYAEMDRARAADIMNKVG